MAPRQNGKTKTRAAAKASNGKPKAPKTKKTVEQLSDEQRQALMFSHRRKLKPLLAAEAAAKAAVTKAFELAKKEGIPKKEIKLAIQFEDLDGQQDARNSFESFRRVARWCGVKLGQQKDMFGEQYFEDGKRAALDAKPRKPPTNLATKDSDRWMAGYDEGRTSLNASRASGFKPLSEAAADLAEKAGISGALGTPPGGREAVDSLSTH